MDEIVGVWRIRRRKGASEEAITGYVETALARVKVGRVGGASLDGFHRRQTLISSHLWRQK